ncbi:MAG: PilZ domain-containing protein [Zymomonas sp.]|nr:MAG: PilZ domain-containing protein [Zymomonas sp.]
MATRATQYRTVTPALVDQRSEHCHSILMGDGKAPRNDNAPVEVTLRDLSVYGCRLACRVAHEAGERIWLMLTGDKSVPAQVVWNDGEHIGCRFDTPIDRSLMRSLTLVIC